jgi:hypothetical protein
METIVETTITLKNYDSLKQQIRNKYGSIQEFARISGIRYTKINNLFAYRMPKASEDKLVEEIKSKINSIDAAELFMTNDERLAIRGMIFTNYKSVRAFCADFPEFSMTFVSNVLNGVRTKKDAKYNAFVLTLQK